MGFVSQFSTILGTVIVLKRWRFLWLLIVVLSAMSNHFLYNVVGSWVAHFGMQSYLAASGKDFADNNVIIGDVSQHMAKFAVLKSLIEEQGKDSGTMYTFEDCSLSTKDSCSMQMLKLMIGQSGSKFPHYVEFSDVHGGQPVVTCSLTYGSEVYCPYLVSLVVTAGYGVNRASYRFKEIVVFRYVSYANPSQKAKSGQDSMCAKDPEFSTVMSRTAMVQSFLLLCSAFIYLLASTVPCINELKQNGFLQLLFRRGLSVQAYWLALWVVTLIEILIVAVALSASHYIQCPKFYDNMRLARLALIFSIQMASIASLVYFLTVVIETQAVIGAAALLLVSACCLVLALSYVLLHWLPGLADMKLALLAVPPGLLGEQIQAILVSQLRSGEETDFHSTVVKISACLLVASLLLTQYIDYVLISGNGLFERTLHFPCLMLCCRDKSQQHQWTQEPPRVTVEAVENLRPVVQIRGLGKEFISCTGRSRVAALTDVSATLYQNELVAFVGHNGSGKSILINILAGKVLASTGDVRISGCSMRNPIWRRKLTPLIGVCHQHDALCQGITVSNSIGLALCACNKKRVDQENELTHILMQLDLREKLNQRVSSLSSGQKRKLCTALALLGDPQLIVLDEPTSNLDPTSRRQLWKLLQEYRSNRCIVVSTSLMEEADAMTDRKIFMSSGAIICAGSSLFLRRAFDCGYIFHTKVKTERHVLWVMRSVNSQFPTVRVRTLCPPDIQLEVSATDDHLLPGVARALEKLPDLVEDIELRQHSLEQISSRLKLLSPMKIGKLFMSGKIGYTVDGLDTKLQQTKRLAVPFRGPRLTPSLPRTIAAMLMVGFARIRRQWSVTFSRIVFPLLLLVLLVATLMVEKTLKGGQQHIWRSLMEIQFENFTKGVCIDDSDNNQLTGGHRHIPVNVLCKEALAPRDNRSAESYIFASKETNTDLYKQFTDVIIKSTAFQSHCSVSKPQYEPCPILFAANWCEDIMTNDMRSIALGFYSLYEFFSVELASTYLLWVYQKAVARFNIKLAPNVTMHVSTDGVWDYRTTFVPLYGIFFQIVIVSIIPATFMDDLFEYKASGVKRQLMALGMSSCHYWTCMLIAHWIHYSIVYIVSTIILLAILPESYLNIYFIIGVFLPTQLLGLASNQLSAYFVSTIFEGKSSAVTFVYSIFSAVLGLSFILAQLNSMSGLVMICVFPQVASVAMTFYGSKLIAYSLAFMKVKNISELANPLSILSMSLHLKFAIIAMPVHICLLSLAIFLMEKRSEQKRCCCRRKGNLASDYTPSDQGVQEEVNRLDSSPRDGQNSVEARHLRVLSSTGVSMVRDVTFGVRPGEILGLLGPNGSGKTAVMSAIAGDVDLDGGDIQVCSSNGRWLQSHEVTSPGNIGYCQSTNPLLSHVTVEEHLNFYASVLGVSKNDCRTKVKEFLNTFHLEDDRKRLTSQLANGCKRRLSMAISLLGEPSIVIIDDPSDGVELDGRRLIWAAIKSLASSNCAVIVTVHTMEEVEGLCTRVVIMNHGLLVAIGTTDQILNRYGQMYTLSVQLSENVTEASHLRLAKIEALLGAVSTKFPDSYVVEQMTANVLVCIPMASINLLSDVLAWLIDNKKSLCIASFSLRKVLLDEIFQLIIKNHDNGLRRQRHSMFSTVETLDQDTQPTGEPSSLGV